VGSAGQGYGGGDRVAGLTRAPWGGVGLTACDCQRADAGVRVGARASRGGDSGVPQAGRECGRIGAVFAIVVGG
jgi:hypothetical protein